MKKMVFFFGAIICLLLSLNTNAQSKTGADYFTGKWNVLLKGLPDGDKKLVFVLQSKDSSLAGSVQDTTGTEIATITNAELKEQEVTLYFTAQGYDVNLVLTKKDEDHANGSLMGMFDAEGERVK